MTEENIEPKIDHILEFRDLISKECIRVFNQEGDIVQSYFIIVWLKRKKKFFLNSFRMDDAAFVRYGTKELTYGNVISGIIRKQVQSLSTKKEPIFGVVLAYRDYFLIDNDPKNLKKGSKIYCVCEISPNVTENDKLTYRYEGTSQILALAGSGDKAGDFTWSESSYEINIRDFFPERVKEDKIAEVKRLDEVK
jgi:hypothetical protein